MTKLFTAWLWEKMYDYVVVEATTQDEADAIADAWCDAGYPKGSELKNLFPQIKEIS